MGRKVEQLFNQDKTSYVWAFHCVPCGFAHGFDQRWDFNGDVENPTFRPSLRVYANPNGSTPECHSFVTDGKIQYLDDCGHSMAGQTVEMENWDFE